MVKLKIMYFQTKGQDTEKNQPTKFKYQIWDTSMITLNNVNY